MIGEQFGNYRVLSLLGEGGMGAVYLAEHPGIGRRVAVKVLHREYVSDEQVLGRLLNEARAANAIRHPNIIEILDSGMRSDGTPYLVMELLEGESLGMRIRRVGKLPMRDAVEFAYQTASALGAAHKKGIVHRDLKPDNLYITINPHEAGRELIKVLDFGIAKLQQQGQGDSVRTRTGTLMGTPIYMSPEQCRGTRSVDHRSDIYSLGVILYEMLIGQPPFVSEGFGDLINMHLNVPPPSPRQTRPEIPDALDALVLKMLAKNPEDRYADMTALLGSLKLTGGSKFTVVGSSPDILSAPTRPQDATTEPPRQVATHDTTFSTGIGERQSIEQQPRGRSKWIAVAAGVALVAGGGWYFARMSKGKGGAQPAAVVANEPPPSAPTTTPTPAPTPAEAPKPVGAATVNVRIESVPAGARVVDAAGGDVIGATPIAFKRPRGGTIKLRLEKEGYAPEARDVTLESDQELQLTLEKRAKSSSSHTKKPSKEKDRDSEPAKL
jgi:serine/threonine-protein kinase